MHIGIQEGIPLHFLKFHPEITYEWIPSSFERNSNIEELLIKADFPITKDTLLKLPRLKKVGLVSTGTDNIDFHALQEKDIQLYTAKGINSTAVRDYVIQAFFSFCLHYNIHPQSIQVGIVGYGNIGKKVARFLENTSIRFKIYDPYVLPEKDPSELSNCDLLTFHVPLTKTGKHPTHEFLRKENPFFQKQIPYIINTSRGKIWDVSFYEFVIKQQKIFAQDVYPKEPLPQEKWNVWLLPKICTPHIAGYSAKGRLGGIAKILCKDWKVARIKYFPHGTAKLIEHDSNTFKEKPSEFLNLRKNYALRKELQDYTEKEKQEFMNYFSAIDKSILVAAFL
ncbi:MAG: hypothetical protein D6767_09235 [Candidatus Hydrogenedentota bacterium]|nr:MAG: hypothetical protein D6767_09235 [Candidatus Hydrogenedentota bacterium]